MRDLCNSAKRGEVCIDDLCRSNPDNTLCGFDESFYEECVGDDREPQYEDDDFTD